MMNCGCSNLHNNISGCSGVSIRHRPGQCDIWIASIYYNKHRYHLGKYEELDDAIKIRKEAENNLGNNFVEWYNSLKETQN